MARPRRSASRLPGVHDKSCTQLVLEAGIDPDRPGMRDAAGAPPDIAKKMADTTLDDDAWATAACSFIPAK